MADIAGYRIRAEGVEPCVPADPLVHLPHFRQLQPVVQLELPDKHHLQRTLSAVHVREDADLLDERKRHVLRFVDDHDDERLERNERLEERMQEVTELGAGGASQRTRREVLDRHDPEIHEEHLEEILAGGERIRDEGAECLSIEVLEDRAAERGLARSDVSRQNEESFTSADAREQLIVGNGVRVTPVEESRVRRETERLLGEPEEGLVCHRTRVGMVS